MPDFEVTSPDGKKYRVTAPEGATQEQALQYAQSQFSQKEPPGTGEVALSAVGRALPNLINTPVALANLAMRGLTPPPLREHAPQIPNLPMKAAEAVGLVDPNKQPG